MERTPKHWLAYIGLAAFLIGITMIAYAKLVSIDLPGQQAGQSIESYSAALDAFKEQSLWLMDINFWGNFISNIGGISLLAGLILSRSQGPSHEE